jgi:hypothetical protein
MKTLTFKKIEKPATVATAVTIKGKKPAAQSPEPETKDSKKPAKAKLEKTNVAIIEDKALQEVISHRELKYKYPENIVDTLKRKQYRQKLRNELKTLQLTLVTLKGQEKKDKEVEISAWKQKHMYN